MLVLLNGKLDVLIQTEFPDVIGFFTIAGVPPPMMVDYPGLVVGSFAAIAGLHTVMLGALVTMLRLVNTRFLTKDQLQVKS